MTAMLHSLVGQLRPIHRRIEGEILKRLDDPGAQAEAKRFLQHLAPDVPFQPKAYAHNAATVFVLKTAFLKAAEDFGLFLRPKITQRDLHYSHQFQSLAPHLSWAEYLRYAFREAAYHPLAYDLFRETAYEAIFPSDALVKELVETVAEFRFSDTDSRVLGDLYEHLMEQEERKRLGYYTTPDFVIDFILDQTLMPALDRQGGSVRYLEPACGTGHFLVRAYRRIRDHILGINPTQTRLEVFKQVVENNLVGVDISEFAVRITLFRFLLEALQEARAEGVGIDELEQQLHDVTFNIFVANTLVKAPEEERAQAPLFDEHVEVRRELDPLASLYGRTTHLRMDLKDAFKKKFHVVNANPPYVRVQNLEGTVTIRMPNGNRVERDYAEFLRAEYKDSVGGNFDLSVPFLARALELTTRGGYVGFITTGKFAKQNYGKKLVAWLKKNAFYELVADLTDGKVFEGVGAYPIILILKRRVNGGNPDPKRKVRVLVTYEPVKDEWGQVQTGAKAFAYYRELLNRLEETDEAQFPRPRYAGAYYEEAQHFWQHPWIFRTGKGDFLKKIKGASNKTLGEYAESIGLDAISGADNIFSDYITRSFARRWEFEEELLVPTLRGENVRDWAVTWRGNRKKQETYTLYTHDKESAAILTDSPKEMAEKYPHVWAYLSMPHNRRLLGSRATWGKKTYDEAGIPFWRLHQTSARLEVPKIIFPTIATHAHFYLDLEGKFVSRHSNQVIYPKPGLTEDDLYALVGLLNSSLCNFWVKSRSDKLEGKTAEKARYGWADKHLADFPVNLNSQLAALAREVYVHVSSLDQHDAYRLVRGELFQSVDELRDLYERYLAARLDALDRMKELQDQIDHEVYRLYELSESEIAELEAPLYKRPWPSREEAEREFGKDFVFQAVDYTADLIEEVFRAQPQKGAKALSAEAIFQALTRDEETTNRLMALGTLVSKRRHSAFGAVRHLIAEALKADSRPIPYDPEAHLVGRGAKKVDIFHERFLLFPKAQYPGLKEDLYGWSGWTPANQVDVALHLAEHHGLESAAWGQLKAFVETHLIPRLDERSQKALSAYLERKVAAQ